MKNNDFMSWIGSIFGTIGTAMQTDEVLRYISLGFTILSTVLAMAFTIWKWWKKASEDGKITSDEINELQDSIEDKVDDIKDALDDKGKEKKDD